MASPTIFACYTMLLALTGVGAVASPSGLRNQGQAEGETGHRHSLLASTPTVHQQMMICNAYASPKMLDIMLVRTRQSITDGSPLAYKQCKDFSLPLQEGDQLDFKAGSLEVGSFYATGLPKSAASLLLVPHRRSPHSVGMSFDSHAFAELESPQIAVVDAYNGKADKGFGSVKISESLGGEAGTELAEEDLKFNTVVAVNPGKYDISLGGVGTAMVPLHAGGKGKYVVLKVGAEDGAKNGGHFPQELVVFPSSAMRLSITLVAVLACFLGLTSTL